LGHVEARFVLSNPELPTKNFEAVGLVDTGSTLGVIPPQVLIRVRIEDYR